MPNQISGDGGNNLETNRNLRDVLEARGYEVHYQEFVGGHDRSFCRIPSVTSSPPYAFTRDQHSIAN